MPRNLSQFAFYALIILTAMLTVTRVPSRDTNRAITRLVSFSIGQPITRIRQEISDGRRAESVGDRLRASSPARARALYAKARDHYSKALRTLEHSADTGYLNELVRRSRRRLELKRSGT